jgi:hypothetical protein
MALAFLEFEVADDAGICQPSFASGLTGLNGNFDKRKMLAAVMDGLFGDNPLGI